MVNNPFVKFAFPTVVFLALMAFVGRGGIYLQPFLAAFLHEAGHLFVMLICRQPIRQITVLPFGVDIKKAPHISSYKADIAVSSAGIIVNFLMIELCKILPESANVEFLMQSNLVLLVINILPIKSLDGGQILEKILLLFLVPDTVEKIVNVCSFVCIILVGSVAVWVFFYSGYNFTLLFMCMYLFTGAFLKKV